MIDITQVILLLAGKEGLNGSTFKVAVLADDWLASCLADYLAIFLAD